MQKITEAFKQQKSGSSRADGLQKKAAEPAVPSSYGVGAVPTATAAQPGPSSTVEQDEAALRQFDLNNKFGPCSGMSRLERWERAMRLGLEPPHDVKELVLRHGADTMFNRPLWEHPY